MRLESISTLEILVEKANRVRRASAIESKLKLESPRLA
jgi:hypothetical protein